MAGERNKTERLNGRDDIHMSIAVTHTSTRLGRFRCKGHLVEFQVEDRLVNRLVLFAIWKNGGGLSGPFLAYLKPPEAA